MKKEKLFGTDGIRGTPGEYPLTDDMLIMIGKGIANFLLCNYGRKTTGHPKVIIGNDTRISCCKIESILSNEMTSSGVDVISVGIIPTPGLAFLINKHLADIGLMISASHNRPEDNGIKFFSSSGHKLSEKNEELIERIIFNKQMNSSKELAKETGSLTQIKNLCREYKQYLKSTVSDLDLKGFKIVVDCGNGAVSSIAPELFKEIGSKVYSIGDNPDGMNINKGCGVLHPDNMSKLVVKYGADIGFAFDGDGDRLILSDENGVILDGDYIMAIVGIQLLKRNKLPKDTIVATVMSNWGLEQAIQKAGGKIIRTPVGDKYILETMSKHGFSFGGEQSGHIIFLEHSTTGDALVTALQILKIMKETNKKLSQLKRRMRKLPQILINVKVRQKSPLDSIARIAAAISQSNSRLKGNGRLLVRYSGTEQLARVMAEGKDRLLIQEAAHFVAKTIKECLGE
ncbi:MAG: phosphoglucosamine mutase [Candidatus Omnitrophica bacterium]|nr:phosphoglucosamine mutase [Candidatus Omnitrophota bacterium]